MPEYSFLGRSDDSRQFGTLGWQDYEYSVCTGCFKSIIVRRDRNRNKKEECGECNDKRFEQTGER